MSQPWSFENYTSETHNLVITELKRRNEELKAMLSSSQDLCLLVKEKLDKQTLEYMNLVDHVTDLRGDMGCKCFPSPGLQPVYKYEDHEEQICMKLLCPEDEDPIPSPPPRREHRRASP